MASPSAWTMWNNSDITGSVTGSSRSSSNPYRNLPLFRRSYAASSPSKNAIDDETLENMPFVHHGHRPRYRDKPKFRSPRKRASKMFLELNEEEVRKSKESSTNNLWQQDIAVGDSVELRMVVQGGLSAGPGNASGGNARKNNDPREVETVRGVVLGIVHRGLGSSLILRDVVYGLPIERRIPMHSPMILDAKVLEKNFVFKKKKKVKRAKLYYFRDRNPLLTKVSKY
eukprot:CAMPEP_0197188398 /NCGR_PEP_ID=MMETSP1423-20130617/17729_1 /TAXON_ID=476441 /ORGANISM="Pseudo-nitzschia heimii, Strain UNC1101" /LENGTH=227 /DNA_ID=CAMNT_0042640207 /DNA_START=130 /DNA_END=816 /DNA_ORIENTATION=+